MTTPLRLLACQIAIPPTPDPAARDGHMRRVASLLDTALAEAPADLVVLPELTTVDYGRESFDRLDRLAEELDGPSFAVLSAVAARHATHIAYGFPRKAGDGYRITQALIDPSGAPAGHYDKLHLAQYGASMEKEYFTTGDRLLVAGIAGIKVAPIICYDIRIPELARTLSRGHGAGLILHCGAYYTDESYYSWHHFVVTRALENQVYVLSLNRAGETYGGSLFCPPWVDETAEPVRFGTAEELRRFAIDPVEIARARRAYSFLADAREDYGDIPLR
ncbi:MAG: carbon-nitrogen hydrolase family protein [Hyphomicrobiales bacterium]